MQVADRALKEPADDLMIMTPLAMTAPPTVLRAALADCVRSRVKLTLDGPE